MPLDEYRRKRYLKYGDRIRANARAYSARVREELKRAAVDAYGGCCECCGLTPLVFLAIDHTSGGGVAHRNEVTGGRGGTRFYRWLRKQGYPPGYRVLCHNCHAGEHSIAGCPHRNAPHVWQRDLRRLDHR